MMQPPTNLRSALAELLTSYHDFNSGNVEHVEGAPTAVEFLRYVQRNRPVVFSGAGRSWPAMSKWKVEYLQETMRGREVNVAETPLGNADSVVFDEKSQKDYFVKPHSFSEDFSLFLEYLRTPQSENQSVKYAQSQDNNLHGEFSPLLPDVPASISFATEAFGHGPDAANVWIGNDSSVSALHKDNYENLYFQVSGRKNFVLISPLEVACVEERTLPAATYQPDGEGGFKVVPDEPKSEVQCWPTVDPDKPREKAGAWWWWRYCRPLRVSLKPGDMLYLPAMWYHKVSQECGEEGICCAVNYWYDMEYSSSFYSTMSFVRNLIPILKIAELENEEEGEEEEKEEEKEEKGEKEESLGLDTWK